MKKLYLILMLSFFGQKVDAQSNILQTYINQGLESNLSLKQENLELQKALKSIDIAKSNLFPKISFSPTYSLAAGGRRLEFPIGDLLNPVYSTLNKLTNTNNFPQVENVNQQLAPNNFHDTKFAVQYPIFNPDIKNNIALQKEILQSEYAKKRFLEYELRHNIEHAYYQYLQSLEAIKIYGNSKSVLQDLNVLNQKLLANHVILKDVVLTSEYELEKLEQQIIEAKKNNDLAKAYFNFLINRSLEEPILADTSLIQSLPIVSDLGFYSQASFSNRPEFDQINSGKRINQSLLNLQEKNAKLPQVFIGANTGFQGFGYSFSNQAYLVAQLGLTWDLFHGYEKKHKIEQTKISTEILNVKLEEVKSQMQLQVVQKYKELQASISNLTSAKGGIEKTQKIFDLVSSRYKNGNAIFMEVSKAQNDLLIAQLTESLIKYDIWVKYADLKKVSGI
ncbi:TolC family protein [Lacihabitans sp. CCS-44]|uniref:TolC family protein n=1 Tax=Lacihabitans sp. CCS-44 TaxID=2487331 RepID=UPI0020CE1FD2|nr:TolC family protein [Lacihabitans sp. CCS-44]MCP9755282.1 TolC family protein [Lacihabitans sp. CCS-44]